MLGGSYSDAVRKTTWSSPSWLTFYTDIPFHRIVGCCNSFAFFTKALVLSKLAFHFNFGPSSSLNVFILAWITWACMIMVPLQTMVQKSFKSFKAGELYFANCSCFSVWSFSFHPTEGKLSTPQCRRDGEWQLRQRHYRPKKIQLLCLPTSDMKPIESI